MVRHHRDNLTGEHDAADIGQLLIFIVFISLWVSDIFLGYSDFPDSYIPLVVRLPIGIILIISSGYLAISGFRALFGKEAHPVGIVRQGAFGIVRHPIYLGEMVFYLGLLFINISLAAGLTWIAGLFAMYYFSWYEEKLLVSRFGEEYERYMKEVPMWFPHLPF